MTDREPLRTKIELETSTLPFVAQPTVDELLRLLDEASSKYVGLRNIANHLRDENDRLILEVSRIRMILFEHNIEY